MRLQAGVYPYLCIKLRRANRGLWIIRSALPATVYHPQLFPEGPQELSLPLGQAAWMLGRQSQMNFRPSVNLLLTHDGCNSTFCLVSLHNTGLLSASLPSSLSPKPSGLAYCLGLEAGQNTRRPGSPLDSVSTSQELHHGPPKSPRYMAFTLRITVQARPTCFQCSNFDSE